MADFQLRYVGFSQTDGLGLVHSDEKRAFYRAHPRGVKRKNKQNSSENVMVLGLTRYDLVKNKIKVDKIS